MKAARGAAGAGCDGDGVGEARGEEVLGSGVEVVDRAGGLGAGDAVLIAESDDRVGEAGALLWGGDLRKAASGVRDASALDEIWATAQTVGADVVVSAGPYLHYAQVGHRLVGRRFSDSCVPSPHLGAADHRFRLAIRGSTD